MFLPPIQGSFRSSVYCGGVKVFYYDKFVSTDETIDDVNQIAKEKGFVDKGDLLINLAAMPITDRGMVNTMRVSEIV